MNLQSLSDEELVALYHQKKSDNSTFFAQQQAYKISLNSLYGAAASPYFRYYNPDIGEGITLTGQLIIRFISDRLNEKLNSMFKTESVDYIIFNDTDSAGLNLETLVNNIFPDGGDVQEIVSFLDKFVIRYINPYIKEEFQRLADYLNVYSNRLIMNREVIADRGLWRAKKNYVLQVWDKEGIRYHKPKLKMMGIETAKSSTPQIVRGSLEEAIKIILNGDEAELKAYVSAFRTAFFSSSVDQIAFPRGVSDIDKWVDTKNLWKKGTPIHVKGCMLYNSLLKKLNLTSLYPVIKNGDKIKFVYLKTPNPYQCNVISFLDTLYPEFGLDKYIDREIQFSKTFLEPLSSFLEIVEWNLEKKTSLEDFWK